MAMTQEHRDSAAKLNPIISTLSPADTLTQCANLVRTFGRFVSSEEADGRTLECSYLLADAIGAALDFEVEARHA